MSRAYRVGEVVELRGRFDESGDGDFDDPTTVIVQILDPDRILTESLYTEGSGDIVREAAGVYRYDLRITKAGRWEYRWIADGNFETANEKVFHVAQTRFPEPTL